MLPQFTNMLSWWQWAAIAAVPPAIVALYFLKLKRRPIQVPSTYLWHKSIEDLHVNSLLQRLRHNLLLLLQLLVILLAILALSRPSWKGTALAGDRFIFLVDNSASMAANDETGSRLAEAKRQMALLIESMPAGSVAMLISFSDSARVEQQFTDNKQELLRRLNLIQQTERPTNLMEALQVASGLANPGRSADASSTIDVQVAEALPATLYIFSDGRAPSPKGFSLGNLEPVYVPIGKPDVGNVGIVAFSTRRNEEAKGAGKNQLQAFGRVENYGPQPVTFQLALYANGSAEPIDAKQVTIDPLVAEKTEPGGSAGESGTPGVARVAFDLTDFESGALELRAEVKDALAVDNRVWTTVNPPQPASVLLITAGNKPLTNVLATERAKQLSDVTIEEPEFLKSDKYKYAAEKGAYDLIVYDRCAPEKPPQANTLYIAALPPSGWQSGPVEEGPDILDIDRGHPLMNLVEMGDVIIGKTISAIKPPTGSSVLMDSTNLGPLLAIGPREGFQDAVQSFALIDGDRFETTWWTKPSFPVFVLNMLSYLGGGADPLTTGNVRPGRTVSLRGPTGTNTTQEIQVQTPQGTLIRVPRSNRNTFDFANADSTGVYQVRWDKGEPQTFPVNLFDSDESDVRPRDKLALGEGEPVEGKVSREVARWEGWKPLLLFGLVMLILEWYIYNRRVSL